MEGVIKGGEGVINALNVCVGLSSIFNFFKNGKFEKNNITHNREFADLSFQGLLHRKLMLHKGSLG